MSITHKPTEKDRLTVETMAGHGIPEIEIARVIGISVSTLRKWYLDELETAHIKANSRVAQSLFDKAMGSGSGSVTACIFWLKVRARWVEPLPAEGYVGKKQQLEQAAKAASGAGAGWANDLETEVHPN
jgi:type II secretory pathway component PulL